MINRKICLNPVEHSFLNTNVYKLDSPKIKISSNIQETTTTSTLIKTSIKNNLDNSPNSNLLAKRIDFENENIDTNGKGEVNSKENGKEIVENVFKITSNEKLSHSFSYSNISESSFSSGYSDIISHNNSSIYSSSEQSYLSCKKIHSKKLTNYLIPYSKKNDEKFKKRVISNLRNPSFITNKSVNFKPYLYGRRPLDYDGNITKFSEIILCKRRKIISDKKLFHSVKFFKDDSGKQFAFNIFLDKEIGFCKNWQKKIKTTTMDDDVLTDNEQLELAHKHILVELHEGLNDHISLVRRRRMFNF